MIKRIIVLFIFINFVSCAEEKTDFEGQWQCNDGSSRIYTFKKINTNSYLLKWDEDNYLTGVVNSNGVFETANAIFALDNKTKELILPENWPCKTAAKLILLSEEEETSPILKDTGDTLTIKKDTISPQTEKIEIIKKESKINNSIITETPFTKKEIPNNITNLLTKESTNYNCLVRQIIRSGEYKLLTVDFIQLNKIETNNEQSLQVVNTNPKLRTFLLTDDTKTSPSNLNFNVIKSFESDSDEGQIFEITTENGVIVSLTKKN
ncbi:hypothetical protein [Lacinutrix mariniflava]|uniref:hypothetical protein n=1 Tax=Lacinutrix mariniflava TaxID=342955 RepID=UPI0006E299AE|nr:hypothetical protein [Lacinutrix mariniflava]